MNERLRVNLSVALWVTIALAVLVCGVYVIGNMGNDPTPAEHPANSEVRPFDEVANYALSHEGVEGMAVACVAADGKCLTFGYGSLDSGATLKPDSFATTLLSVAAMRYVERGAITLEEAYAIVEGGVEKLDIGPICMENTFIDGKNVPTTIGDMSQLASMLIGDGSIGGRAILSKSGVDALLTPPFGWSKPSYLSLLTDEAVEFCARDWAIVVDRKAGVAVVVIVDSQNNLSGELFEDLRSKLVSVARAITSIK
jgi:hypothetical protein